MEHFARIFYCYYKGFFDRKIIRVTVPFQFSLRQAFKSLLFLSLQSQPTRHIGEFDSL